MKCKDNTEGGGYECALPPPALTASEHARLGRELCSLRLAILSEGWLLPPLARGVSGKGITEERRRLLLHLSLQRQPPSKAEVDVATVPVVEMVVTGYDPKAIVVTPLDDSVDLAARSPSGGRARSAPTERCR